MARDRGLTLYEHVEALAIVDAWFDEAMPEIQKADGEVPEALAAILDLTTADFNDKVERVALKVNQYMHEAAMIESARDDLTRKANRRRARAEYLKRYLHFCLTKAKVQKVNGLLLTVRLARSPVSVKCALTQEGLAGIYDRQAASDDGPWLVTKTDKVEYTLNRTAAIQAHDHGEQLPAGVDVERNHHLRID